MYQSNWPFFFFLIKLGKTTNTFWWSSIWLIKSYGKTVLNLPLLLLLHHSQKALWLWTGISTKFKCHCPKLWLYSQPHSASLVMLNTSRTALGLGRAEVVGVTIVPNPRHNPNLASFLQAPTGPNPESFPMWHLGCTKGIRVSTKNTIFNCVGW